MPKELWINLPVKDLKKAKEFYAALEFSFHPRHEKSDEVAGLIIGDHKVLVMLFPESAFKSFTRNELADTKQGTEVLLSIDAQSKEEVDEMIQKARQAGGAIFAEPSEHGFMYGAGFADLDGHRWNVLYMDMSQVPQA
ncbi:glyoxalase [Brevibacillus reuszeri]|uniref:VOC family protein n=1 Tax=Brevibacillus reuszeri TaxID=54915 RepID=UPI001B1F9CD2|nr:VOC family protein [Brevibacillus reuszeri]GIO04419.1 glyoxalase [Brevibacillus reuszeri]